MANIFLSYAREDAARAARVAKALESDGHQLWWDRRIGAGSTFSAEIDAALRGADLVMVLWSRRSVVSHWVLDEAAAGRDSGRLLPVLLEPVEPPLGFRQLQALDLAGAGRQASTLKKAVASRLAAGPGATLQIPRGLPRISPRGIGVAGILAVLIVAAVLLWPRADDGRTTIAVVAAESGDAARSRDFARSIAIDLGRYRAGPAEALSLVDGESRAGRNATYQVKVGLSGSGGDLRADVGLESRKRARLLWSSIVEGEGRPLADIRQQAASEVGEVLRCIAELQSGGKLPSAEVEGLYLNGCAAQESYEKAISAFGQITRAAPDFGLGWANLALFERWTFDTISNSERQVRVPAAKLHLKRAKALAPNAPETIAADALIRRIDADRIPAALAILDRGIAMHPDSALLHRIRSDHLQDAGRMRDSVAEARRARELNPLSTATRDSHISVLAYSGRVAEAYEELNKAERIWPGSEVLSKLRFRLDLRFGDPQAALRLLAGSGPKDATADPADEAWRLFLEARADSRPAKVERALDSFRARYRRSHGDIPGYLQLLGTFGRIEEAFRAVEPAEAIDGLFASTHILFRPYMRGFRADPRFMALAARLGLLAYWRKSGIWPDFCSDPKLPYDCATEAAKLTPAQLRPASPVS